ncbi:carbohydrate ABC transporter permease [Bifidobacterium sp. ESL0798]|uniref:carbohydrate ABC transporter permease n=1 Tax=unclassified Bifidobacterium TaxID=2608897 RepID=UPI0023F79487|nr:MULTISPECIES: carbohydrate ABC transporter permease [unclassified Bifidobacterium]MDF7640727.1 carbohydrate ABC transporter permease [Bifidobacterium sp. ESL0784]WEV73848.1 carbohydrate ABC transporter permease [Bifidobacterium sp. ESL0798]
MSRKNTKNAATVAVSTGSGVRKNGYSRRHSPVLFIFMLVLALYSVIPLLWLLLNATKSQADILSTFGLGFGHKLNIVENLKATFTYEDGSFLRWLGNTVMYVVIGAGGATLLAALAGYGMAMFDFAGKQIVMAIIIGAIAIPGNALVVPTFLLFAKLGLTNTPLAVILPSLISPFGFYLVISYVQSGVPREIVESARVDGAGEVRIFFQIVLPLLMPCIVTVLLFAIVSTWNNYFLPLIMLNDPKWYPLTVGLAEWNAQATGSATPKPIYNLVIMGALVTVIPIIIIFLMLQRYWESGLSAGSVKQ